jgi:uncharacterized protein
MPRSLAERFDPEVGPKRILALDGGGVKGVLSLGMLKALEGELRRRSGKPNFVLADYYDLIGGTSTGGIIAAGLATGNSVDFLIDMYLDLGPKVFGKQVGDGNLFRNKFDPKALRKALEPVLGRKTLGSPDLKTGFAIHAKRIDTGSAWVLTNNPHSKFFDPENPDLGVIPNKKYRLIDLVQASAAAPTFFDEVVIPIAYDDKDRVTQRAYFVDGAVGANNNPSMQMLMLALLPGYGFGWKSGGTNLMMTSIGTGVRRPEVDGESFHSQAPALRGVNSLRSMIYDTQVQGIVLLQALSEPAMPWRINGEIGDMAGQKIVPNALLDFQRIDVRLDRKVKVKRKKGEPPLLTYVEEVIGRELAVDVIDALDEMANGKPANMKLLLEIGEAAGPRFANAKYPSQAFDLPDWSSWSLAN